MLSQRLAVPKSDLYTVTLEALQKLFAHYDTDSDGFITLDEMLTGSSMIYDHNVQSEWATRQARAGARRMRRLFTRGAATVDGKISASEFVGPLQVDFDRRLERGLSVARAVAEIEANLPGEVAQLYGSE